jgi:hypothetical protein
LIVCAELLQFVLFGSFQAVFTLGFGLAFGFLYHESYATCLNCEIPRLLSVPLFLVVVYPSNDVIK